MKSIFVLVLFAASLAAGAPAAPASGGLQYYVDPLNGKDAPSGGGPAAPWKTTAYAVSRIALLPPASQAGLVLNLRANALYPPVSFPPTLHGTAAQPIIVQPYDGERVAFDGGEPRFRQPDAWERVPDQKDEWRSKDLFTTTPGERVAWGQLMDSRLRLITYMDIEDMRAVNESYRSEQGNRVELSDPRPAPGPVVGDETHKIPYTYLGPGLFYQFENPEKTLGRVHLRLSSTHIGAAGIQDYAAAADLDPSRLDLSIARENALAGRIGAQHLVLRNLTFQNGGRTTLLVAGTARNVTFDHCEVYGAQYGVRMEAASELRFHHCTFDGGLASWTSRSDVKNEYYYHGPADCRRDPPNGPCINEGGAKTHDILVVHRASRSEYVNCTFRRGHDGLQLSGDQLEVRDSLFEDLNDEALQLGNGDANTATDVKIHGNVIRQALSPLSFALAPTGGPVYFYRNVVDQRAPTRGTRILPPDAPAPWVWRYGSDFKNAPTLPFHCYQNTFISSHVDDKGSYVSHLFYADPPVPPAYLNNLQLMLNLDWPLSRVPAAAAGAVSDGNVWYRYHLDPEPLFRKPMFTSGQAQYFTLAQLWADFPDWESHSQYADPLLANFTDEYFTDATVPPNTDYRPAAGGPAHGRGIALPATLPDDFPAGSGAPDVGARPVDAPVMAVGVDGAALFPAPGVPVALAGDDRTVADADGDGFAQVTLDASASHDPDGTLASYAWSIGGKALATGSAPQATFDLPEGEHYLRLVVTDDAGTVDSDAVRIRILPAAAGENRLACPGFEEEPCAWQLGPDATPAELSTDAHSGARALRLAPGGPVQRFSQRVPASPGRYTLSGWLKTQSLVGSHAALRFSVLAADGAVLESGVVAQETGSSPYTYRQALIELPEGGAFIELAGELHGAGGGQALFDDLRVRDGNLLQNGRFEARPPGGRVREAPGWEFGRGGAVVDDAANVRSGRRALAFAPYDGYHLIRQAIVHVPGRRYRVSGWVKTIGLSTAPTCTVRFLGAAGQNLGASLIAATTSEGAYTYVSRDLPAGDIPAAAAMLRVELQLAKVSSGTAYFEDLMIAPIP